MSKLGLFVMTLFKIVKSLFTKITINKKFMHKSKFYDYLAIVTVEYKS
jgi:hypothetical protein